MTEEKTTTPKKQPKPETLLNLKALRKTAVKLRMERQLDALVNFYLAEQEAKTTKKA
jgi:hypothetical protein